MEEMMNVCHPNLSRLLEGLHAWIVEGPCQSESGAFSSWVNAQETVLTSAFEYPEITGYALTYLSAHICCCDTDTEQMHRRAERAADWLLARIQTGNFA